jgi:hypothetical protein
MSDTVSVHIHKCESFNDKDLHGNVIPNTFKQERYDRQFPGEGVPVLPTYNRTTKTYSKPICPFCNKDVSDQPLASKEQRKYMEGGK